MGSDGTDWDCEGSALLTSSAANAAPLSSPAVKVADSCCGVFPSTRLLLLSCSDVLLASLCHTPSSCVMYPCLWMFPFRQPS